jgi:hypothetical protein
MNVMGESSSVPKNVVSVQEPAVVIAILAPQVLKAMAQEARKQLDSR